MHVYVYYYVLNGCSMKVEAADIEEANYQADSMLGAGSVLTSTTDVSPLLSVPAAPVERNLVSSHY